MDFIKQLDNAAQGLDDCEIHLTLAKEVRDIDIAEVLQKLDELKRDIEKLKK